MCVCVLVTQPCSTLCDPMDYKPPGSSVHVNSLGKNIEVGSRSFFQGILLIQGSNLSLLHCSQILFHLSHQGNPWSTNSSPVYTCRKQYSNSKAYIYCNVHSSNIYHRQDMEATQVPFFFFFIFKFKDLDIWALLEFSYSITGFPFLMFSLSF